MIDSDNFQKISQLKHLRKKFQNSQKVKHFKLLELLGKGIYAQEISQKYSVSKAKLSRIIKSFKKRNLIEQIQTYPKRYKLTKIGTLILAQGDLSQTKIQEFTTNNELLQESLPPVRAHLDRFSNKLVQKPSWLSTIRNVEQRNGMTIKKVRLHNWNKFIAYFHYQDFKGLDNIEICKKVIIYNFKQKISDQLVFSEVELQQRDHNLISNCKQARIYLQQRGFLIGQEEPIRCQKPHWATSSKDPRHIGQLGKKMLLTINTPNESLIIDDSPGLDGEEETTDRDKVISYFALPDELEKVKDDVFEIKEKIGQIHEEKEEKPLKTEVLKLEGKVSDLEKAIISMAKGIKEMTKTFSSLNKPPEKEIEIKTNPGGMYR